MINKWKNKKTGKEFILLKTEKEFIFLKTGKECILSKTVFGWDKTLRKLKHGFINYVNYLILLS